MVITKDTRVSDILEKYGFYDKYGNPKGKGFVNQYKLQANGKVVYDEASGLLWQQNGSSDYITYAQAEKYIQKLNREKFAGYSNWRLPTLEEAMSLMEPKELNGDLYIDPIFNKTQRWIWTCDKYAGSPRQWVVNFNNGKCNNNNLNNNNYVRAVRFGESSIP